MENALLDRTVAADRAAPRARRRREQHRQHQHHRLQGRRLGVRGIPDAGRARRADFQGTDRRLSFVHDRATWHDFSQGADPADRQSARRRDRRQRLPGGADAARRALHPQRRAADQRHRPARHQRRRSRCSATAARSCSSTTDRNISITPDGTHHGARGRQRHLRLAARQAPRSSASTSVAAAAEGRRQHLPRAGRRSRRSRPTQRRASSRARSRNRTCAPSSR